MKNGIFIFMLIGADFISWIFFNNHHPDPNETDTSEGIDEQFPDGMFRFEKVMK